MEKIESNIFMRELLRFKEWLIATILYVGVLVIGLTIYAQFYELSIGINVPHKFEVECRKGKS